ncbi:MAG: RNA 2',3'-cyclic phosphodiesterase, partial [Bacteroidia bacterium]|nr:RNA 2',3'-cyclic phosphodiesterase [Bacteroidia bacterium]
MMQSNPLKYQPVAEYLRTFVAIKIQPEKMLVQLFSRLPKEFFAENIRWADPAQLHLTLKFLGETSPVQAEQTKLILETVAAQFAPFQFTLSGLGYFKNQGQPKVLYAGIDDSGILQKLAQETDHQLAGAGFEKETRGFHPHLTLGRIKSIRNETHFFALINEFDNTEFQRVDAKEMILFQSILTPRGPVYKDL